MEGSETDEELLARAVRDPDAFGLFYRRHATAVLVYLRHRTGDVELAADLTADVFAAAFAARARFRPAETPARGWVFGIANNLLAQSWRERRRASAARRRLGMERLELEDEGLREADEMISAELAAGLHHALVHDVTPDQREAVLAHVVEGRGYGDLAAERNVAEPAVRQRVSRGLARLEAALRKDAR